MKYAGAFLLALLPSIVCAQQPDSVHQHGDTLMNPRYNLPAITITATRTQREAASTATTVGAPAVQRTLTTSTNPWELLRQAAGLEVHIQGQGPGFASDAALRGFSSDHSTDLALWIDGVPINEPVNGHAEGYNDWSLLFPQSISDLEVIKGPTSPLFGNFALAGVVNVRTLERMHGTRAWLEGGSDNRFTGALLTGFDHEKSGGVLGVRAEHTDGWRPNSNYNLAQAHGGYVADINNNVSVDGGVNVYGADWRSPGFITADQFDAGQFDVVANPTDRGFKRRAQERFSVRVLSGPQFLWRSTVYATQGRWQLFITTPPEGGLTEGSGSQTEEEDTRYGLGLTSAATWMLPRSEITIGTQNRLDHADYENWFTTARMRDSSQLIVSARQLSGSLFLASSTDVGHHVRVDVGGRYDALGTTSTPQQAAKQSASKGVFSPKIGALYHLPKVASLYANVSRGFRQSDGVIEDPGAPFITDWAYEAGVKIDVHDVNATVSLFRTDVSNEQTFNEITLETESGGASKRQGVDMDVHAQPSQTVSVTGSLTIVDAKYVTFVTEEGESLSDQPIYNTAKYVGDLALDVGTPDKTQFRVATNVVGPYTPFDEPGVELPAYALLHVSASKAFGRYIIGAGIRNALDRKYPELRAGGFVSPGQPRSFTVTLRTAF